MFREGNYDMSIGLNSCLFLFFFCFSFLERLCAAVSKGSELVG